MIRRAPRCQRDAACGQCGDEQHQRSGEEYPEPAGGPGGRATALVQEVALETIQRSGIRRVGPFDRCRQACPAIELTGLATRCLPLRGGRRQTQLQEASLGVLFEPGPEPRPVLQKSLVNQLDAVAVGDEQPSLDEHRQYVRHPLVLVGIELGASHPAPRERLLAADEPEQDPPGDQLVVGVERSEGGLRVPSDSAADATASRVCREGQRPPVALFPQVDKSGGEQR